MKIPKKILNIAGKKFEKGTELCVQIYPVVSMKKVGSMILFGSDDGEEQFYQDEKGQVIMKRRDDKKETVFALSIEEFLKKLK